METGVPQRQQRCATADVVRPASRGCVGVQRSLPPRNDLPAQTGLNWQIAPSVSGAIPTALPLRIVPVSWQRRG